MMMRMLALGLFLLAAGGVASVSATEFPLNSKAGRAILQKAQVIRASRHLDYNQYNQYNNQAQDNGYYEELPSMSIKFIGCSSYVRQNQGGDDNDQGQQQQNNNYDNNNQDNGNYANEQAEQWVNYQELADNDGLEPANLVRFTLCYGCDSGCDGEYVLNMQNFMEEFMDWKMSHDSFWCERVRENCECYDDGYSWKECYSYCFSQVGLTYQECLQVNNNGQNIFNIQQYVDGCTGIQFYNPNYMYNQNGNNGDNFQWQNFYYLSLSCYNHEDVVLKAFYDNDCTYAVPDSEIQEAKGEYTDIPYLEGKALLAKDTCISCKAQEQNQNGGCNYNNNQNDGNGNDGNGNACYWDGDWEEQPNAEDICRLTVGADGSGAVTKCDKYDKSGCEWIETYLPRLDGRMSWNYAQNIAALRDQINRSERLQFALVALVLGLLGALAGMVGYNMMTTGQQRTGPKHRDALLEYRRENAESTDLS